MKNNKIKSPQEVLNHRETSLEEKHQQRLDEMLSGALDHHRSQLISDVTLESYLETKACKFEDKYQKRLEDITKQSLLSQKLNQYLDKEEESLKLKHNQKLQKMTKWIMKNKSYSFSFFEWMLTPVPAMALASLFTISIINLLNSDNSEQLSSYSLQANAKLPSWVKDTDVPLELLENFDFYVWLSQQNQFAQTEDEFILATTWYDQHCTRERCTSRNFTQRLSRTVASIGEL